MFKLIVFLSAVVLSSSLLIGGPQVVDPQNYTDAIFTNVLNWGLKQLDSTYGGIHTLKSIKKATIQVVAGVKYTFEVELVHTNVGKTSVSTVLIIIF